MLLTNIVLFVVIGLCVLASGSYIVHRVRSTGREARAREERRAAALLAEVGAARVPTAAAAVGSPTPDPTAASTDRLAADLESFFTLGGAAPAPPAPPAAPAPPAPVPTTPAVAASAHDLATRLRLAADRIDELATTPGTPATELADAVVAVAAEAASPAALLPVLSAARSTVTGSGGDPLHDVR